MITITQRRLRLLNSLICLDPDSILNLIFPEAWEEIRSEFVYQNLFIEETRLVWGRGDDRMYIYVSKLSEHKIKELFGGGCSQTEFHHSGITFPFYVIYV